jgi:hypothetical protein
MTWPQPNLSVADLRKDSLSRSPSGSQSGQRVKIHKLNYCCWNILGGKIKLTYSDTILLFFIYSD